MFMRISYHEIFMKVTDPNFADSNSLSNGSVAVIARANNGKPTTACGVGMTWLTEA